MIKTSHTLIQNEENKIGNEYKIGADIKNCACLTTEKRNQVENLFTRNDLNGVGMMILMKYVNEVDPNRITFNYCEIVSSKPV